MIAADLLFSRPPTSGARVDLVFGETSVTVDATVSAALPGLTLSAALGKPFDATLSAALPQLALSAEVRRAFSGSLAATLPGLTLSASVLRLTGFVYTTAVNVTLPALTLSAQVSPIFEATIAAAMPGLAMAATASYDVNVSRPTVSQALTRSQAAVPITLGAEDRRQAPAPTFASATSPHGQATRADAETSGLNRSLDKVRPSSGVRHTGADRLQSGLSAAHQEMLRDRRPSVSTAHQGGVAVGLRASTSSQDRYRDRRPSVATAHQKAVPVWRSAGWRHRTAAPTALQWGVRHQEAVRPPIGVSVIVVPPGEVCYTPDPNLVFSAAVAADGTLVFICDNHDNPTGGETVIVPIRRTYMVLNNVTLRRVTGNIPLPVLGMSITLDYGSWTYGFSAGLPASAMQHLGKESDGSPALLEASVNGQTFLFLAESRARSRQFPRADFTVRGRGKNAVLDDPYAPAQSFTSTTGRTLQQIMSHVLTVNGVSLGWDVDFGITDWFVPANTWAFQGSYIAALNDIAGAAGAYLQPHPTSDTLRLLPLYPSAPWDWGTVTPDFVLPSAIVSQESVDWLDKPAYNAVVVAGTTADGVRGNVTRLGTAGDLQAPMATHPLITHVDAARQRGRAILSDTGAQVKVGLRLPVLPATGIIMPGKFVSYVDGADTRFGITRGVDVQITRDAVWQTLSVETHE